MVLVIHSLEKNLMKSSGLFSMLEYCSQCVSSSSPSLKQAETPTLVLPYRQKKTCLSLARYLILWNSSLLVGVGARQSVVKKFCSVHGSIYPTVLSIQKKKKNTLTRTNGNDTASISLTLMRWYVVCGIFYSTNSSNHCPVWQAVLQKPTLPLWKHGSVEKGSHIGPQAGIGGRGNQGRRQMRL